MPFDWPKEQYDVLDEHVKKIRHTLEVWYQAMEDGSIHQWMPILKPGSKPTKVTADYANRLVEYLDESFAREIKNWANQIGYDAPPGFCRLDIIQRVMLAQEIANIMEGDWEIARKEEERQHEDNREQPTSDGAYLEIVG